MGRPDLASPALWSTGFAITLLAALAVLALVPTAGAQAADVPVQQDWNGGLATHRTHKDLTGETVAPADMELDGAFAPDGSSYWSFDVVEPTGVRSTCDYFPARHDDNEGDGTITPPPGALGIAADCTMDRSAPGSLLGHLAYVQIETDGYCIPERPPVECSSSFTDSLMGTNRTGLFALDEPVEDPDGVESGGGTWQWSADGNGWLHTGLADDVVHEPGQIRYDHQTTDWTLTVADKEIVCHRDRAFLFLPATATFDAQGTCGSDVAPDGASVDVEARFDSGPDMNVEAGDLRATLSGHGTFTFGVNATGTITVSPSVPDPCGGEPCIDVAPDGSADGHVVAVGSDDATGIVAVAKDGDAEGSLVAVSGRGNANGGYGVGASGTGDASGMLLGASVTGDARSSNVAASATGDADGHQAVSVFGEADGHHAASACSGVTADGQDVVDGVVCEDDVRGKVTADV